MLSLVLYPYVYLLARTNFETQAASLVDAARVLGAGSTRAFFTVALPASRPVVAGGVALAVMEAVADYGVVEYFGVSTFTTGIFRTWFALGDRQAALQLAGWLFLAVAVLIVAEQAARRGGYGNPVARASPPVPKRLTGLRALLATVGCALPLLLGLVVPVIVLGALCDPGWRSAMGTRVRRLCRCQLRCRRGDGGACHAACAVAGLQRAARPSTGKPFRPAVRDPWLCLARRGRCRRRAGAIDGGGQVRGAIPERPV